MLDGAARSDNRADRVLDGCTTASSHARRAALHLNGTHPADLHRPSVAATAVARPCRAVAPGSSSPGGFAPGRLTYRERPHEPAILEPTPALLTAAGGSPPPRRPGLAQSAPRREHRAQPAAFLIGRATDTPLPPGKQRRVVICGGGAGDRCQVPAPARFPGSTGRAAGAQPVFFSCPMSNKGWSIRWIPGISPTTTPPSPRSTPTASSRPRSRDRARGQAGDHGGWRHPPRLPDRGPGIRYNYEAWFGNDRRMAEATRARFPAAYIPSAEHFHPKNALQSLQGRRPVMTLPPPASALPAQPPTSAPASIASMFKQKKIPGRIYILDHIGTARARSARASVPPSKSCTRTSSPTSPDARIEGGRSVQAQDPHRGGRFRLPARHPHGPAPGRRPRLEGGSGAASRCGQPERRLGRRRSALPARPHGTRRSSSSATRSVSVSPQFGFLPQGRPRRQPPRPHRGLLHLRARGRGEPTTGSRTTSAS